MPDQLRLNTLKNPDRGSSPYVFQPPFTANWGTSPTYMSSTITTGSNPTGVINFSLSSNTSFEY
ncbi:MAG: hypothetical protein KDK34_14495, partial [Leptospiraceae bacterium]|nr:hypothetical protein [Leptospiraceae bacterium]